MNGEANGRHLSAHRISAEGALMIAVECTVNKSACAQGVWGAGR